MSYTDHDRYHRPRHETHARPRDTDSYAPRHAAQRETTPTMRDNVKSYSSSYYDAYDYDSYNYNNHDYKRDSYNQDYNHDSYNARPRHRRTRKPTWPPSPAVEDESTAAATELAALVTSSEGEPPVNTRGTVDQEYLLDEIDRPEENDSNGLHAAPQAHSTRRRSVAERGNMPHLKTDVDNMKTDNDPIPLFTKRISTPYSYTPQKETNAASYMLSPEPMTPASASQPRNTSTRDPRTAPPTSIPIRTRPDSNTRPAPQSTKNDVFDDSTSDGESNAHLRTNERKPARYSFVKSESQKEDLRTNLRESQTKPEPSRRDSTQRPSTARTAYEQPPARTAYEQPPVLSRENSYFQSPRSSSSSVNSEKRRSRPVPVDTVYANSSRPSSRSGSPKIPSRLRESPPGSRPSSRGNAARPASPLAWSTTIRPPSPRQVSITEADWHATYPPVNVHDRSRPPSRFGRHETIQIPLPRVDVQSPSPVRPPTSNPLPYPVEDHHAVVCMPGEEHYQFDHSTVSSPRPIFRDAPRVASPSIPNSPRLDDGFRERSTRPRTPRPEDAPRARRSRSNSNDSKHSVDGRTKPSRTATLLERPLPSCPRGDPTDRYDDWYSLPGYRNFDICPSCYKGVFADTPFAAHFSQTRRQERPTERFCDFSNPWMRLAWLLTIKQRRPSLDLFYALADISDSDRPCPGDREVSTDRVSWYGISDQHDGHHVANFAVCSADVKMLEVLFPTVRGYFTRLPNPSYNPEKHICSLRVTSRRFPKYLDLLVSLDAEAASTSQPPDISRLAKLARQNAFKGECAKDKAFVRKAWHFIPHLPEFTVCEECYNDVIWPALTSSNSTSSSLPRMVNKTIQLVPNESLELGSSCALYSKRMRRVWDVSARENDITYFERKVLERRRKEVAFLRERRGLLKWLAGLEKGSRAYERAKEELRSLEREWSECE